MGQFDAIESVTFRHEEGNEGKKIVVKRRIGGLFGGKLLKRKGQLSLSSPSPSALSPQFPIQKVAILSGA
jgi:hypothetical protein